MPDASLSAPTLIKRLDYQPPAFLIDRADLAIDLGETGSVVRSRIALRRNPEGPKADRLRLDGRGLELLSVEVNGKVLTPADYELDADSLTLPAPAAGPITVNIETRCHPETNAALEGLYKSGTMFCTQCEAEGFRHITYYLDRPDVLARFTTTITADAEKYPVLLSNGNLTASGKLDEGRHFARWEDPHPKPSYLFALVAGDLAVLEDSFTTRSGRKVRLRIFTHPPDIDKCDHAMAALKHSMKWDEDVYGLEYDLDDFMIVAVPDFNMGAMENKGLNVFNTKYVLARAETATDQDFANVETVIAHEYFHNWTGNRITCRDWFQLSLKEGLTVFRDQQFSADMGSAAVKRIADVRGLRASQFMEDASPMAHPVRPDSYIAIENFYTATVYQKGAEVVRMFHTLLGAEGFRRGMDLYVERHDGQAVTCDDFATCMADANGADLDQFRLWYAQSGTPEVTVSWGWNETQRRLTLRVDQSCLPTPGQPTKKPFHLPLAIGLLDANGADLPIQLAGEATAPPPGTRILEIRKQTETFEIVGLEAEPIPSLLRGFSAPVKLHAERSPGALQFLAAHDSDPFARWEAFQDLAMSDLRARIGDPTASGNLSPGLIAAFASTLEDRRLDDAFVALALTLPSEGALGDGMPVIDVDGIHRVRSDSRVALGLRLAPAWEATAARCRDNGPYRYDGPSAGRRALANLALGYRVATMDAAALSAAMTQLTQAQNMTDQQAAFAMLVNAGGAPAEEAVRWFETRWRDDALVMDKWFATQAMAPAADTLDRVANLLSHPRFDAKNPNKLYALIGSFANGNAVRFHERNGRGYQFLTDRVLEIDGFNAKIAARLISPLGRWRRYDAERQGRMRAALERVLSHPGLSRDVFEIASKSLSSES